MKLFRDIIDKQELATLLKIDERALNFVELLNDPLTPNRSPGCLYPAVSRNAMPGRKGCQGQKGEPMSVVHNQGWFPRPQLQNSSRGSALLGLRYLRDGVKGRRKSCFCSNLFCLKIGYSSHNKKVPPNMVLRKKVANALRHSLSEATIAKLRDERQHTSVFVGSSTRTCWNST
jgi:hypothetical protein